MSNPTFNPTGYINKFYEKEFEALPPLIEAVQDQLDRLGPAPQRSGRSTIAPAPQALKYYSEQLFKALIKIRNLLAYERTQLEQRETEALEGYISDWSNAPLQIEHDQKWPQIKRWEEKLKSVHDDLEDMMAELPHWGIYFEI